MIALLLAAQISATDLDAAITEQVLTPYHAQMQQASTSGRGIRNYHCEVAKLSIDAATKLNQMKVDKNVAFHGQLYTIEQPEIVRIDRVILAVQGTSEKSKLECVR